MSIFKKIRNWIDNKRKYNGFTTMEKCMKKGKGVFHRMSDNEIIESLKPEHNDEVSVYVNDYEVVKINLSRHATKINAYTMACGDPTISSFLRELRLKGFPFISIDDFSPGAYLKLITTRTQRQDSVCNV